MRVKGIKTVVVPRAAADALYNQVVSIDGAEYLCQGRVIPMRAENGAEYATVHFLPLKPRRSGTTLAKPIGGA